MSKKQEYLIIAGLMVLIFPFFALIAYVHPQGDDFFFAVKVNELGVFIFVKEMYFTWSGRYASMFIGAFDPLRFESLIYLRIILSFFLALNIFSLFTFFRSLTTHAITNRKILLFTLVTFAVILNSIPDIFEYLYWFPSVTAYQLGLSLLLLFIANFFFLKAGRLSKRLFLILNSILAIIIIGLLELFIMPVLLITSFSLITRYKNKESLKLETVILTLSIILSIVMVIAPGNYVRMGDGDAYGLIVGVYLTLKSLVYIFGYLFQNPTYILGLILFTSFIYKTIISKNRILNFRISIINPLWILVISLFIISLVFLPSTLLLKSLPAGRIFDLGAFIITILLFFNIFNFVNYYHEKITFSLPKFYQITIGFLMIMFTFSGIYVTNLYEFAQKKEDSILLNGNILNAYNTLFFEAKPFNEDMENRYETFQLAKEKNRTTLVVKPLDHHPEMLIFVDISDLQDPGTWIFNWEAKYYGMDSIYIETPDTIVKERLQPEINVRL